MVSARRLRVGTGLVPARTYPTQRRERTFPRLILQGDWLQKAGFAPGDRLTVTPTEQGLIIRKKS